MNKEEIALKLHSENKGKLEVKSKVKVENAYDLSMAYTPGVAEPCKKIRDNAEDVYKYTSKSNMVAVITDGSAVLGLGNIGAEASIPVMEGKAILFKNFANVDAFPICIKTQDVDEIVNIVKNIVPIFGGINLEDISAPRCFEIEERLIEELDIPVFHDDQHGTAVIVLAAIINALKLVEKELSEVKIAISGAGAAAIATAKLLLHKGAKNLILCNSRGILDKEDETLDKYRKEIAKETNPESISGSLADAMKGADIFIGLSGPSIVTTEMVETMNDDAIVFAMANPIPEIYPEDAIKGGARVTATGRSDFANQINNVSVFPGIMRGALDVRAKAINNEMKIAAAESIAEMIDEKDLTEENIIPDAFNKELANKVAERVAEIARETDVAKI